MKPVYLIRCKVVLFFTLQLLNTPSFCQAVNDYRSAIPGNWNAIITWERYDGSAWVQPTGGQGTPNSTDGVITIRSGHTITISANVSIDQATIDAGGQITVNNGRTLTIANGTGTDLIVNGTLRNSGTVTPTGTLSFSSGSTYLHNRNGGVIPSATWNTNSDCNIVGITGTAPSGLGQSFGNFTWDCIGQTSGFSFNGALTNITGNLTIGNTNISVLSLASATNANYTLNIAGNLIVNDNAWLAIANGDNITATVNVAGNFAMSGVGSNSTFFSYHLATGGAITLNKIILNVSGNFSQSGGYFDFADGHSDAPNFTELRLGGDFSQTGTGIISTSTSDNSITNGLIQFNKAGTQTFLVTTPGNLSFTNFVVNNGSTVNLLSNISLQSSATAVWGGQFTVSTGGELNVDAFRVVSSSGSTAGVNNSFILSAGAHIISTNTDGLQNTTTTGSISTAIATRSYRSDADYEFRGDVTGVFTTTPLANTARDIIINKVSGSVTLSQPMTVTGAFILTAGNLTTTLTNLLTLNDNAVASGGNFSPARYVDGPVQKIGDDAFLFPVGKSGIYAPVEISAPTAITDAFRAEYIRGSGTALGPVTAPGLVRVSNCEYWDLERITGTATVNVTLSWSNQSPCNAAVYVDDLATLTVAHFNGSTWDSHGNSGGMTGNVLNGTVTRNGVSSFSPFTLGSTSSMTNLLPLKFGAISGYRKLSGAEVEWKVYNEENVSHYEVERSANGIQFSSIGRVSSLNQNRETKYSFFDASPLAGISFYRIKSIDYEGKFIYSVIVRISPDDNASNDISIYPNPVKGEYLSIQLDNFQKGSYVVRIIGINGQQVFNQQFLHNGGSMTQVIVLPPAIKAGMYILCLENAGNPISNKPFIIQ
jgi:Secretion system C-terminal sorting domain